MISTQPQALKLAVLLPCGTISKTRDAYKDKEDHTCISCTWCMISGTGGLTGWRSTGSLRARWGSRGTLDERIGFNMV